MSTFYAKSALEVLELFPWISVWFDVNVFVNSSMIIRWIQMSSVSFQGVSKSLKTGRTVHHQLRISHCKWKLKLDKLKSLEVQIEIKF